MKHLKIADRLLIVSNNGDVFTDRGGKLSQYADKDGYKYVLIRVNGRRQKHLVHRLVAMAYINTSDTTLQINHKDGNKANNSVSNLEWCTNSENQLHSRYILNNQTGFKDVAVKCVETGEVFISTREAWRKTRVNYCHISECANGKRKSAGGLHWERV